MEWFVVVGVFESQRDVESVADLCVCLQEFLDPVLVGWSDDQAVVQASVYQECWETQFMQG